LKTPDIPEGPASTIRSESRTTKEYFHETDMNKQFKRGLWWVKRDFRLADNGALSDALAHCETVVALFIIEPELCAAEETSFLHYHAWQQASDHLSKQIAALGGRMIMRVGHAVDVLDSLRHHYRIDALFSHEETGSSITFKRDRQVKHWAKTHQIPWFEAYQNGVVRGLNDRDQRQPIIQERLFETPTLPVPTSINAWPVNCEVDTWPAFETLSGRAQDTRVLVTQLQTVTESAAQKTLQAFLYDRGVAYSGGISSPNTPGFLLIWPGVRSVCDKYSRHWLNEIGNWRHKPVHTALSGEKA